MEYYSDNRLSASKLKGYLQHDASVAHWMETHPSPSTDAMRLGTALHLMMEKKEPIISPHKDFRKKEAREWKRDNPDFLKESEYEEVKAWQTSILNTLGGERPYLWECWDKGEYEKEFFTDTHKAKIDCIHDGVIADWKTCVETSREGLMRSVWRHHWALQCAHYLDMAKAREFNFVVVSKTAPHPIWILHCTSEFIEYGRSLKAKAEKIRSDFLAGNSDSFVKMAPPPWADSQEEDVQW